jgi:sugar lactone lactonase YvrE
MKNRIGILIGLLLAYLLAACSSTEAAPAITATAPPAATSTPAPELADEPVSGPAALALSIIGDPNLLSKPNDLEVDRQGNLYVVDSFNSRIQKFDQNGKFLTMWGTAGQGDGEFRFINGDAGAGAIAVDEQGNVYVADWGNSRLQKFDGNGQFLAKWGTRGAGDGQFSNLLSITVDKAGNVYVLDGARADIQKFDGNGQFLAKWGSKGSGDGQFNYPTHLTVDGQDNVYVVDGFNNRLQKFDGNGQFLAKWGSTGTGDGQFNFILAGANIALGAVAADNQGNVYVADYSNNRIQKFDDKGQFLAKWGSAGIGDDQFIHPIALAVDPEENVYVDDYGNGRIQKFQQP